VVSYTYLYLYLRPIAIRRGGHTTLSCNILLRYCREESDPAPAKRQKHGLSSVPHHDSAISGASKSVVGMRHGLAALSSSQQLCSSGVPRARNATVRSSPRMLASTAASRSGARKLRHLSQSTFASRSPSASRDVSMSSVTESSLYGISLTCRPFLFNLRLAK